MNDIDVAKSAITAVLPARQGEIESDCVRGFAALELKDGRSGLRAHAMGAGATGARLWASYEDKLVGLKSEAAAKAPRFIQTNLSVAVNCARDDSGTRISRHRKGSSLAWLPARLHRLAFRGLSCRFRQQ